MISVEELTRFVSFTFFVHAERPKKPSNMVRKWDRATPYGVHPVWCAMTFLHETMLSEEVRMRGALALLYHDILEDTVAALPGETSEKIRYLVREMTFESSGHEMVEIWSRDIEVKLLKLYDKVSNLMDGAWMSVEKRARYTAYTLRLADEVEQSYGALNIVRIVRAICS